MKRAALLALVGGLLGGLPMGGQVTAARAGEPEDIARGEKIINTSTTSDPNGGLPPAITESRQVRRARNRAERRDKNREEKKWRGGL